MSGIYPRAYGGLLGLPWLVYMKQSCVASVSAVSYISVLLKGEFVLGFIGQEIGAGVLWFHSPLVTGMYNGVVCAV